MFDGLQSKLSDIFDGLKKRGALKEADVDAALREIRVALLEETLSTVLPMCSNCKNIKIDQENWGNVADYLETKVEGTHVTREICPTCRHLLYGEFITAQK